MSKIKSNPLILNEKHDLISQNQLNFTSTNIILMGKMKTVGEDSQKVEDFNSGLHIKKNG